MSLPAEQAANIDRFFTAVKSLNELDKLEIRNVVGGMLSPTLREQYVTLHYHRAAINVEHVLTLTDFKNFQVITMIARSVLETAVELRLIASHPDAATRISLFDQVQKLKFAKRISKFKMAHPNAKVATDSYEQYVVVHGARIIQEKDRMWPAARKIVHWTLMSMEARCKHLGGDFEQWYDNHYAQLSWYVHSGVTGIANMTGVSLALQCGVAFHLTMECYASVLESVVNEFKIYQADDKLKKKITYAKMLPFTDSQEQINGLAAALGL